MLVAEVRGTQLGGLQLAGLQHPQERASHEYIGVHDRVIHAGGQHAQVVADQSHIVSQRHPAEAAIVIDPAGRLDDRAHVCTQVGMRQAHALRVAGRPGRVLDECEIARRRVDDLTAVSGRDITHQNGLRVEDRHDVVHLLRLCKFAQPLEQPEFGKQGAAAELAQNAEQLEPMLVADADRDRYRHDAAQHRGPESDDETLVRLAEDDEFVAGLHAPSLQRAQQ